jgi:hypothetical protein
MSHRTALLSLALSASALTACIHASHSHGDAPPGHARAEARRAPPPHAPAHGYRHKQPTPAGRIELIFDSGVGAYVVVGWPDHYWHRDHYYRYVEGHWMTSGRIDGGWATCSANKVPPGLVQKHAKAKRKGGRWSYPASRGD